MLKVTSYQLPVVGWDFERRMTILRLQNFFTNTILLKPGTDIHQLHFSQYFKKHQFWDRWQRNTGGNGVWAGTEMSTSARGFLYTGHSAFIDPTTPANRVSGSIPLRVPTPLRAESPMYSGVRLFRDSPPHGAGAGAPTLPTHGRARRRLQAAAGRVAAAAVRVPSLWRTERRVWNGGALPLGFWKKFQCLTPLGEIAKKIFPL